MRDLIDCFHEALVALDQIGADKIFQQALAGGAAVAVVEQIVAPALEQIGRDWEEGRIALSQIYMSGRFCEKLVDRALPPADPQRKNQPTQAIVVLDDYHMLGQRIVYSIMRSSGFELYNYGRMEVGELVARALADGVRILLISVLMMPSALKIREVREAFNVHGAPVKILVGGAPFQFDPKLWVDVGADAMGRSAADAVAIVQGWIEEGA